MTLFGIDISHHQARNGIDLQRVLDENPEKPFLFARTSHGTLKDEAYQDYQAVAAESDLLFAAYHYLSGLSSPKEQAITIREQMDADPTVPLIFDFEPTEGQRNPTMLTVTSLRHELDILGIRVPSLLYFPEWFWHDVGRPNLSGWSVWQSHYGPNDGVYPGDMSDRWDYSGREASMLQYTSRGRIPGYAGDLDVNAYRGTRDQLAQTGWFKDYKDEIVATKTEIQQWVAETPILVNVKTGETQPLQRVLRTLLQRPAPTSVDVDAIAAAVVAALPDDDGQVPSLSQDQVEAAVKQALREGVDSP